MPKNKHGRGRGRQPQRRHLRPVPVRTGQGAERQELFQSLRIALRSEEPLEFLAVVSGLLEVTDPRSRDPFSPEQRPGIENLVESFVGTPYAETTAALTAIKALTADEVLAARIGHELKARRHPIPEWLKVLDQARPDPDVWFMTHVLGDGDDYLLGVVLPTGTALSALVYVDHNMGSVVKDAFVVPEPLEDLAIKMGTLTEDPDQSLSRIKPATARAAMEAAIESGSLLYPPVTSDSWPMCRPLVEWMLRMLPVGGVDALMALDEVPLPDEEFDWTGVAEGIRPAVEAVLEQCDGCADALFDVEHRTAMRRFLARVARNDPKVFTRKGSPVRGAAAVAWVISTGNRTAGVWSTEMTTKDLLAHFAITGSVSDRAGTLIRAAGMPTGHATSSIELADPGLLVSKRRRSLMQSRDRALAEG